MSTKQNWRVFLCYVTCPWCTLNKIVDFVKYEKQFFLEFLMLHHMQAPQEGFSINSILQPVQKVKRLIHKIPPF
jgi:hypothetical protein